MQPTLLSVQGASKRFGDVVALETVNLEIREGDIIGLVGSNGAGKTTLVRHLMTKPELALGFSVSDHARPERR